MRLSFLNLNFARAVVLITLALPTIFVFQNCAIGQGFRSFTAASDAAGTSFCVGHASDPACAQTLNAPTCIFNGQALRDGQTVVAFADSSVAIGESCRSETRTCRDGALTGSFVFPACTPGAPRACVFNGVSFASGATVSAYLTSSVAAGGACTKEDRLCADGTLGGSFAYASCSPGQNASCLFDGKTIAHGASVAAYVSAHVSAGSTCTPETRTCYNGALSGKGDVASCVVDQPAPCSFNGQTVASGQSVSAFTASTVAFGQQCAAITRTCQNGVLSGAGDFASCNPAAAAACLINGQTIAHGGTITLYQAAHVEAGRACVTEVRSCADGSLSGTATQASCVVDQAVLRGTASLGSPKVLINAQFGNDVEGEYMQYAYAPALIRDGDGYHAFFCSAHRLSNPALGWDAIRTAVSATGEVWSKPKIALEAADVTAHPSTSDRAACDPSVVRWDAGDGPFYYLFYSGNGMNQGTAVFVARAASLDGPFAKFTTRGTWEINPADPKPIVRASHQLNEAEIAGGFYGLGEQTVVVRDNQLYMFFVDDTAPYPDHYFSSYVATSKNGVDWSQRVQTDITDRIESYDVKVDPDTQLFVMFATPNKWQPNAYLDRRTSADGVHWSSSQTLCPNNSCFPAAGNNVGVSGDATGALQTDQTLVAFGSPDPNFAADCANDPSVDKFRNCSLGFMVGLPIKGSAAAAEINLLPRTIPFYRFWTGQVHFFTNSINEGQAAGYAFEQTAFNLFADAGENLRSTYRCSINTMPGSFLSADPACEGFRQDSFSGYVRTDSPAGTTPLYRLYNPTTGGHLMTTNAAEKNVSGFQDEAFGASVEAW